MPTYTYRCAHCGRSYEERRLIAERDVTGWCDHCDSPEVDRVFTPTVNLIVPGHFMLDKDWAMPVKGDPAWAGMSPSHARAGIHQKKVPTLREEFDKVKDWT